jgi:hypothetical protein
LFQSLTSQWKLYSPDTISESEVHSKILSDAKSHILFIKSQVELWLGNDCSISYLFSRFLGPTSRFHHNQFKERNNECLRRKEHSPIRCLKDNIDSDEFLEYLEVILLCHIYDVTPKMLQRGHPLFIYVC